MKQAFHFELYQAPKNPQEARNLADALTNDLGAAGWSLVAVVPVGGGSALLFTFQQAWA
jgi:hypothetical protein